MKLTAFLVLLLAFSGTKQACAAGCLKCDTSSNCIVPDLSQGYVLSNNAAVKATLTNCSVLNPDGTCISCSAGYYLDASTKKCTAVPTASAIANCSLYSTATSCSRCASGYYLNNTTCAAVTTTIANCQAYSNATTCSACNSNYILSLDSASCVSIAGISNCSSYSYVSCGSCSANFFANRNAYLNSSLATDTAAQKALLASFASNVVANNSALAQTACSSNANYNCATFAVDSTACTVCNSGYFLDTTGACNIYPTEPIANCGVYSNATTCFSCVAGYLLSSNACSAIATASLVANCATYDTKSSTVSCLTCSANYYLQSANTCTIRTVSANINNCATKDNATDKCATCAANYILSSDGAQCFSALANCTTHSATASGGTLNCSVCASSYYTSTTTSGNVSQTTCAQGSVTNCATYQAGSNGVTCQTCLSNYYLLNNACIQQPSINNCTAYNGTTANQCATCNIANSFNFFYKNTCQTITGSVTNCATYSGGTLAAPTCASCAATYYLANGICNSINVANCLVQSASGVCSQCAAGYIIAGDAKACIAPLTYVNDQCLSGNAIATNPTALSSFVCGTCKQGAFPYNFNNQYACLSYAEAGNYNSANNYAALTSAGVGNCLKYDASLSCVQCDPSVTNKFLDTVNNAKVCASSCTSGAYSKYTIDANNQISAFNVCKAANAVTNCAVYAPNIQVQTSYPSDICIQCAASYINVPAAVTSATPDVAGIKVLLYANADPNGTADANAVLMNNFITGPNTKFPQVTCIAWSSITQTGGAAYTPNGSEPIANCAYYVGSNNNYSCSKCNQGYTGTPNATGFITTCTADAACNANLKYGGLDMFVNNVASCHVCTDTTQIPVIAYVGTSITDPTYTAFARYNYAINTGTSFAEANNTTKNIVCRAPATPAASIAAGSWVIDSTCGIAALQINTNGTNNKAGNVGNYCAACKPGYRNKASPYSTIPYVKDCEAVPNCVATGGNLFNGCSVCATGYILTYSSSNIDFTTCTALPNTAAATVAFANCYAASVTNNLASSCMVCKPGYNLNVDNVCDAVQPVNCSASAFRVSSANSITANGLGSPLDWALYASGNAPGCNRCNTGYVARLVNTNVRVCLANSYISTSVDAYSDDYTNYVPRCKNYQANTGNVVCLACQATNVPSASATDGTATDGAYCYPSTSLANCASASSATNCTQCSTALYSLSSTGTCVLGAIANCVSYNYLKTATSVHTSPTCSQCAPDYYLSSNTCVMGNISNCSVLNSAIRCTTCASGYILIGGSGNYADVCYPSPSALACTATYSINANNNLEVNCTACTNNATQIVLTAPTGQATTTCLSFSPVSNCSTYNVGATPATSDFKCTACASGYYLANNKCTARTNKPAKCSSYDAGTDTCNVCDSTSYASSDKKTCVDYPSGISKCLTYTNATTCTACKSGYYLSTNACVAVPTAIANCNFYSSATQCSACASGYALTSNTCVQATATGCATYTSATACATCSAGSVLVTTNGTTNCNAQTKTGCATLDINSPYNCLTCSSGYYLSSGACLAATTIARCTIYASASTCQQCDAGYALSVDKTTCTTTASIALYIDANCNNSQLSSTPVCSRCGAGRYFVNGSCTGTCSSTGCLACSPSSNATCYVCNTGYYQDSAGKCNVISSGNTGKGVSVFGVLSAVVMIIAVMFK